MRFVFLDFLGTKPYTPNTPYNEGIGGTQSAICYYCEYLVKLGHDVTLINSITTGCVVRGVNVLPIANLKTQPKQTTDVIVLCGGTGLQYVTTFSDRFDYKLSILWHGHYAFEPAVSNMEKIVYSVDFFGFASEFQRNAFMDMYNIPIEKTMLMMYGVSPAFLEPFDVGKKEMKIMYISSPDRGLEHYLEIWPKVHKAFPEAVLEVYSSRSNYGSKDSDWIVDMKEKLRKMPNTNVCEPVGQDILAQRCRLAAIMAYPTHFVETSCVCYFETGAVGCIPVVSDMGVFPFQAPACVPFNNTFADDFANTLIEQLSLFEHRRVVFNKKATEHADTIRASRNYTKILAEFADVVNRLLSMKQSALDKQAMIRNNTNGRIAIYQSESTARLFSSPIDAATFFLNVGNRYYNDPAYTHMAEKYFLNSWSAFPSYASARNLFMYYEKTKQPNKMIEWYFKSVPHKVTETMTNSLKKVLQEDSLKEYNECLKSLVDWSAPAPVPAPAPAPAPVPAPAPAPVPAPAPILPTSSPNPPVLTISERKPSAWDFFKRKYVVNLERMPERKKRVSEHLQNLSIDFSMFKAYDASKSYEALKEQALRTKIVTESCIKELKPGALGCLMSHYKLWELEFMLRKKDENYWILIMEDDVLFHPMVDDTVLHSYLDLLPADAKFVKLGWAFGSQWHSKNIVSYNERYVKFLNNGVSSTICYAVHSSILETLLLKTYDHAIDDFAIDGAYGFKHLVDDADFYKIIDYPSLVYKGVCSDNKDGSTTSK